uniref:Pdgfa associated protein 1b n=1 Tax=Oryzias melastigma TaxID=30732 RepID=A0A3B3D375_ORYME
MSKKRGKMMKEQRRKTHLRINYQDLVQMTVMMMTLRYCWNLHLIVTLFLLTFFCISVVCTYGDFGFYLAKCQLLYHLCLQRKKTGVEGLIEIENPNRVAQKSKKVTQIELDEPRQLSRREREEIEKQKAKERYMKMHLAGKTDQAKADLARLAIIRKQREEAAKKKDEEKKAKEAAVAAAAAARGMNSLSLK